MGKLIDNASSEVKLPSIFAVCPGLRFGELAATRWEYICFDRGVLNVKKNFTRGIFKKPKSGRERVVDLDDNLLLLLLNHRDNSRFNKDEDFVFSQPDGKNWNHKKLTRHLKKACEKAKIKNVGWHIFRHTYISLLVEAGNNLKIVQHLLVTVT